MSLRFASPAAPAITIDDTLTDTHLLGAALGDITSWQAWRIILKAAFGIALNREDARAFAAVAGDRRPPTQRVRELWAIVGAEAANPAWRQRWRSIWLASVNTP